MIMKKLMPEDIMNEIDKDKERREKYIELWNFYLGEHPIKDKKVIGSGNNNKISLNYTRNLLERKIGYLYGGDFILLYDKDKEVQEEIDSIFAFNSFRKMIMDIGESAEVLGEDFIVVHQDENGNTRFLDVDAEEMIVYKDEYGRIEYAIRYFYIEKIDDRGIGEEILNVEVYTDEYVEFYEEGEKGLELIDIQSHIYGVVPVAHFRRNKHSIGSVESLVELNNQLNTHFSLASDDLMDSKNSYLIIRNIVMAGKNREEKNAMVQKMMMSRVIQLGDNGEAYFINKEASNEQNMEFIDSIIDHMYNLSNVPNITDEKMGNAASGKALLFRTEPLENESIKKELMFVDFIEQILRIIEPVIRIKTRKNYRIEDFTIKLGRNTPSNYDSQDILNLSKTGLYDDRTLIAMTNGISDVDAVLEAKKAQDMELMGLTYYDDEEDDEKDDERVYGRNNEEDNEGIMNRHDPSI